MSGIFLDSNVVLYLLSADAHKANTAEYLLTQNPFISVQVLNEVTSVCLRKLKMSWAEIHEMVHAIKANCQIVQLTVETHAQAMLIYQQYQLSFYDAHILAAAHASGSGTLMSEDMQNGQSVMGIRIQNPFAVQ
jgi:predicted nucleic acid-binding protein